MLAPIALIAVGVAIYLIIHATVQKNDHSVTRSHHAHTTTKHHHHHKSVKTISYTVQPGDTLSGIAAKTHISLTRLEALNPSVSANALQSGQRLRLRR